jgi:hypothetical protein
MCFHYNHDGCGFVSLKHQEVARIPHLSDVNLDSRWPTRITR